MGDNCDEGLSGGEHESHYHLPAPAPAPGVQCHGQGTVSSLAQETVEKTFRIVMLVGFLSINMKQII